MCSFPVPGETIEKKPFFAQCLYEYILEEKCSLLSVEKSVFYSQPSNMSKLPIAEYLKRNVLVLDGGQGTEMERRGLDVMHPLWSTLPFIKKNPAHLKRIQEMYHDFSGSGARALATITYKASFVNLKQYSDGEVATQQQYE